MAQDSIIPRQVNTDDCWLYAGLLDQNGYGVISSGGKNYRAHRVVYESEIGPIPDGLVSDHLCRVRCCINPDHIEPVTNLINTLRGESPAAKNVTKTHCMRGHPFDKKNTHIRTNGWRLCKTCHAKDAYGYRRRHDMLLNP